MQKRTGQGLAPAAFFSFTIIVSAAANAKPVFLTFDPPGSTDTWPQSINDSGFVTGYFKDRNGHVHGFVRAADGGVQTIDVSGSTLTDASSINAAGVIAGYYWDAPSVAHGFVRPPDGPITTFDVGSVMTQPARINDSGVIVGYYASKQVLTGKQGYYRLRGFLRYPDGTSETFDPVGSLATYPTAINAGGAVTGYYFDKHGTHGFSRSPDGAIAAFDSPDADDGTFPNSINDAGIATGYYEKTSGAVGGFLRQTDGTILEFSTAARTFPFGINKSGFVGGYSWNGQHNAGFTRDDSGKVKQFQVDGLNTTGFAMNASHAIAGNYYENGAWHGYIRMP